MNDFNDFIIVAEDEIAIGQTACMDHTIWKASTTCREKQNQRGFLFTVTILTVKCNCLISNKGKCLADILFIKDHTVVSQVW
ncbi:hypothetical protein DdX_22324 [Ditylenchus destructor]|uniref:Uncharacterized protein n=1 Tax=Ditylenchus destructor TaxID=166010 RepID=A0AAD4QUS9_9BILA|nr:hypothetical protein DdX_22324 [Ditylenchus destructor]